MRYLCVVPVLALAACGGQSENKAKAGAETLEAGQYEVTAVVTQFRQADEGAPKIKMEPNARTTRSACVPPGGALPPELFADEGLSCTDASASYARNGVINVGLRCSRPDLQGDVAYSVNGSFDAQSFRADRQLTTTLTTDGDVVIASTLEGRRTGDCTPGSGANESAGAGAAGGNKQ
jgi:hypothetical protein